MSLFEGGVSILGDEDLVLSGFGEIPLNASIRLLRQTEGEPEPVKGGTVRIKAYVPGQNPVTLVEVVTNDVGLAVVKDIPTSVIERYGELGAKIQPEHLRWDVNLMRYEPVQRPVTSGIEEMVFLEPRKPKTTGIMAYVPTAILLALGGTIVYNAFFAKK